MADIDPIAELRKKFLASLKEAEIRVLPLPPLVLPPSIGPEDREWLEQALAKLDDHDA